MLQNVIINVQNEIIFMENNANKDNLKNKFVYKTYKEYFRCFVENKLQFSVFIVYVVNPTLRALNGFDY